MAYVDWTDEALDSLARHDLWRTGLGWEPIAKEIFDAVEAYFERQEPEELPHFLPGKPARRLGVSVDMLSSGLPTLAGRFCLGSWHRDPNGGAGRQAVPGPVLRLTVPAVVQE